jgi:hypothetical protein
MSDTIQRTFFNVLRLPPTSDTIKRPLLPRLPPTPDSIQRPLLPRLPPASDTIKRPFLNVLRLPPTSDTIKCPLLPEIHRGHSITWLLTKFFPDKKERLKIKVDDMISNVMAALTKRSEDNFTRRTVKNIVCKVFRRYIKTNSDALFHDILLPDQSLHSVNLNEVRIMSADGISIKNSKHPLLNMVPFQGRYISLVDLHDQIPKSWPGWDAKQVTKLLLRQTHLNTKRQEKNTQAFVGTRNCKSRLQDQAGSDDEAAKKRLSHYAYDKLFLVEYKHSCRLRYIAHEDVTVVWPNGKPQNCDECVVINGGHICGCQRRIAFKHQCRHEMCIIGKLDLSKYSTWWLNCKTFNASISSFDNQLTMTLSQLNPLIPACHNQARAVKDGDATFGDTMGVNDDSDDDVPLSQLGRNAVTKDAKLSYQLVAEKATNLVRLAQSDPAALGSLFNLLDQLAGRLRKSSSSPRLICPAASVAIP